MLNDKYTKSAQNKLYLGLNEVFGTHAVLQLEGAEESAVISETAAGIDLNGLAAFAEQVAGNGEAFLPYILRNGRADLLFKAAGQGAAVKKEYILQPLQ